MSWPCVSPLHSSALQGKKRLCVLEAYLPLFLGSLQGLAFSFPIPPYQKWGSRWCQAHGQAHLPIVELRVLSFQTGTLVALTL